LPADDFPASAVHAVKDALELNTTLKSPARTRSWLSNCIHVIAYLLMTRMSRLTNR
jgi:hypothetical protein